MSYLEKLKTDLKPFIQGEKVLQTDTIRWDVPPEKIHDFAEILDKNNVSHLNLIIGLESEQNLELRYIFNLPSSNGEPLKKGVAKVVLPNDDTKIPSVQDIYPVGVFHEREAFDMLGIGFEPEEKIHRILLPDPLPADIHPLRKKYTHQQLAEIVKVESEKRIVKNKGEGSETIIERADYAMVVGPQHPTNKEPIRFTFHIEGETIQDVDVRVGFNYRGIEKAFEARSWNQNLYLAERICGICSNAHQLAMGEVVEKCARIAAPERAKYIRIILAELERVHSHILWYGVLAHDAGYDSLFHITWRDREIVMDVLELISGNRVNYSMISLGGVRRDITPEQAEKIAKDMKELRKRVKKHEKMLISETSFVKRLADVAPLSYDKAKRYSAVGPTIRAAGVKHDLRKDDPTPSAYKDMPFDIRTGSTGDVYDTLRVRIDETYDSIDMIIHALDQLPSGDISTKFPTRVPLGEAFVHVEAPRGEDYHYVRSQGGTSPYRYRVRAPTLQNLPSLVERLKGVQIADIPVGIRSIDPCIGCMERVTFIKPSGKKIEMSGPHLKKKAYEAYATGRKVL
ncbi:MAG: hydrogenase large subunit [Candidatus Hodarchaeales archaeon]